jgi:hypothetical protein
MFICKKCNRSFRNITQLVSHLTHPKSNCKCNIKEYYDIYLRKENEGICIYCGRETAFASLSKGYPNNKCKHCRNCDSETQKKRKKTIEQKREAKKIKSGYYERPEVCEICSERFENKNGLAKHISQRHSDIITIKEYYDKYFKKEGEGICQITEKETNFKSLVDGYYIYSGKGTNSADFVIQQQKKNTLLKNHGVDSACKVNEEQRIENYKKTVAKKRLLKEKRFELISVLRKLTIDKFNKLQCQICGLIFENYRSLAGHVNKGHKLPSKIYYDKFFRKDNEGICPASNKETTFISVKDGYLKYKEDFYNQPEIINTIKDKSQKRLRRKVLKNCYKYNIEIIDLEELKKITSLLNLKCLKCNNIYKNRFYNLQIGYGKCPYCFPKNSHKSKGENEILSFLKNSYPYLSIYQSYKKLRNSENKLLELDIYIPEKKIAIEFNGLYWHSEKILTDPINYHINKTNICNINGINLLHIFEDEWYNKKHILKKMISHKLNISKKQKIYARNCYIKEIDSTAKNKFLDDNHIQGRDSAKIKLGLFLKGTYKLISVMTFTGKNLSRGTINISDYTWDLSRFAIDLNYIVIGAAGKLLKYFTNTYRWDSIFSYADLRYSTGDLYYKLGFENISQTKPSYWYVDNQGRRYHRFNLRKRPDEPKDVPEWKLRHEQGYYRIWDCGHLKFEKVNQKN